MQLDESRRDGIDILKLEGEIDMHYAPVLRMLLNAKAKARCAALLLDFSGVSFIDSTGIAAVIEYLRDASEFGGRFCVAGLTQHVADVFEIVRLNRALPVFATVDEAHAALTSGCVPEPSEPLFAAA